METISSVFAKLSVEVWIAIAALLVAIIAAYFQAVPVIAARRDHRFRIQRELPGVKATINKTPSVDGWRSIQMHIVPQDNDWKSIHSWRIRNAVLLSPRRAKIAFARNDDSSLAGPIVGNSERMMSGRQEPNPQLFAMEFFICFPDTPHADRGTRAKFRVTIWRKEPLHDDIAHIVWAEVPGDAEATRPAQSK